MTREGQLVIYSGPSGVGKGTLLEPLITPGGIFTLSVSVTTREPRAGETDGVEYHFVTEEVFDQMEQAGEMLESACYDGHRYGTPRAFVEEKRAEGRDVILEIEGQGARQILKTMPEAMSVFVMPPSMEELRRRLQSRGTETEEQLECRLAAAREEIQHAGDYDFIILNDTVISARQQLLDVVYAGKCLTRFRVKLINEVLENVATCDERDD